MISIKIHKSYRTVVAVCDSDLIGKKFEQGKRQLEIKEYFFKGDEFSEEKAIKTMIYQRQEDATFNIVGKESINAALKAGIISKDSVAKIQGVPFTLILL